MQPTTAHGWGSHVTGARARCATAPSFVSSRHLVSGSQLGSTRTAMRKEESQTGRGSPGRFESSRGSSCTCVVQESIVGLGTCLRDRGMPPQLVVPSHDRRSLLIPGVKWGSLFTESCRPNKTLLSSSLSHSASHTGIPLAGETQKSKFGQQLCTGATNGTGHTPHSTVHDEAALLVGLQAFDNPHPQTLSAVSATQIQRQELLSGVLAKNTELQCDPVSWCAADTGRKQDAIQSMCSQKGIRSIQVTENRRWRTSPRGSHIDGFLC